jgi:exopolysaccharide biosynthesis polyprenyl glycosylphosphotransferase
MSLTASSAPLAAVGLAWLGVVSLPQPSLASVHALLAAACVTAISLALWPALRPLLAPRAESGGVLVLGREDLAAQLLVALNGHERTVLGAKTALEHRDAGIAVDPVQLKQLVRQQRISRIVVVEPDVEARREITAALLECRLLGVEVEDAIEIYQRLQGKLWLAAMDPGRLVFSKGFRITRTYLSLKRVLDVTCAIALLLFAAPLMALIAIAIKLESRGSVLFRQERVGQVGRTFTLYKFRSMRQDAEVATGPTWARKNDDRATRIGRILRRFHLDEIPQAINVLRGDLSFVGPRPERPCFVEALKRRIDYYDLRLYVKPGITGWAQVWQPYADSIEDSYEKLEYDLYYVHNVSVRLDLGILLRTAKVVVCGRGR